MCIVQFLLTMMEKRVIVERCDGHSRHTLFHVVHFLLLILLACVVSYDVLHTRSGWKNQGIIIEGLQLRIKNLELFCDRGEPYSPDESNKRLRREVLSSNDVTKLSGLLRGPQGPSGIPGKDGRDGRPGLPGTPGQDFTSLALLRDVVKQNVDGEWLKLSRSLPVFSGEVFTRWGSSSCTATSKLVYKGTMAGPDFRSTGGGSNYQCMPDDPEYFSTAIPKAQTSTIRVARYDHNTKKRIPCAVCETNQRGTRLMIPAKTRCPSREWTMEYIGYLMSELEHSHTSPTAFTQTRGTGSYVCVDEKAEPLPTDKAEDWSGPVLHAVAADCSSQAKLQCPPYLADRSALSCVVCTK